MNANGDKCTCEEKSPESDCESPSPKESKKSKISLSSLALNLRRGRSLQQKNKRSKKTSSNVCCESANTSPSANNNLGGSCSNATSNSKKSNKWHLKFYCGKKEQRSVSPVRQETQSCCKCTCYKRTEDPLGSGIVFTDEGASSSKESTSDVVVEPVVDEIHVPEVIVNTVEEIENSDPNAIREAEQSDNGRNQLTHIFVTPNFIDLHA